MCDWGLFEDLLIQRDAGTSPLSSLSSPSSLSSLSSQSSKFETKFIVFSELDAYAFSIVYDAVNRGQKALVIGTSSLIKELFSYHFVSNDADMTLNDDVAAFIEVVECDTLVDIIACLSSIHLIYTKGMAESDFPDIVVIFSLDSYLTEIDKGGTRQQIASGMRLVALIEDSFKYLIDTSKKKLNLFLPMDNPTLIPTINRDIFTNIVCNHQSRSRDGALSEICIRVKSNGVVSNVGSRGSSKVFVKIDSKAKSLVAKVESR